MTVASPFSILLIQPPPANSAMPPSTLAQAKKMVSDRSMNTHLWDARRDGFTDGGKRLLDLLEQLSERYDTIHILCLDEIEPTQLKDLVMALNERQPGLRLALSCIIDNTITSDFIDMDECGAIVHIQWRLTGPLPDFRFFKAFSRAGVWNHLV